jgi:hypothetical protein
MKTGIACQGYCHSFSFAFPLSSLYSVASAEPGRGNCVYIKLHQDFYYAKTGNNTNKIHSRKTGIFCNNLTLECNPAADCNPKVPNACPAIGEVEK